ncbi:MAG TPA: DUF5916 domain-containing protein [Gemmatimonadaceae bacterium]|jgi:hypothetical protein|nr:DUF5916 domain-containing protein [Gemmatimonadaceae bacterium]
MIGVALVGIALSLQTIMPQATAAQAGSPRAIPVGAPTDSSVGAIRAEAAPVIDGKDDDAIWKTAPEVTRFRMWRPTEDKDPRFKTVAKIAYDAANLYVVVRAFDPHPDSIIKLLERRDTYTASDMVWIFLDTYHDRRTGYEFGVNAAGVKMDMAIYDDGNEDSAWDGVWDAATSIDSLGWIAEYRIPLSQLRYGSQREHTFGVLIDRYLYRTQERFSWPLLRQSKPGFVSQFGMITGLADLEPPRRLEAVPYVVTKAGNEIVRNRFTNRGHLDVGGDVKYRLAPNVTLDATINPDFGQVEADPSVLNLTAYESFFDERRPFFVTGRGQFQFGVNCSAVNCNGEGLFYSRRIGRTPSLAGNYGDTLPQSPTRILGAGKLLGTLGKGFTLGVLDAVTQRVSSPGDTTYEPGTNYAVVRAKQDLRKGNSGFGAMFTSVNRRVDQWSSPFLTQNAYVGAVDFRHKFLKNQYEISGSLDASRVQASKEAMLNIQRGAVHYYQRPDAALPLDSNRTVLQGDAEELRLGKVGGKHLMFESAYMRRSAGFELNDLGYLQRADQQSWATWMGVFDRTERAHYKRLQWNNNWWQYWSTDGLPLEAAYNTNFHLTFKNNWGLHTGGTVGQLGTTYDDRKARGGPAVRQDPYLAPWLFINADDRRSVVPGFGMNLFRGDDGRNWSVNLNPSVDFKMKGAFSSSLSANRTHNVQNTQWFGRYDDALGAHYTFAHLDQTTTSATMRLNYTFTPDVSVQGYLSPFVSKGTYSHVIQLSQTPRATRYEDRYAAFADTSVTNNPGGFNYKAFQSNLVFRWEYAPGSTLFAVWNQGRQGYLGAPGTQNFQGDVRDLMRLHPSNTFLIKMSYWLNR